MDEKDKSIQDLRRENNTLKLKIAEMTRENTYFEAVMDKAIARYGIVVQTVVAMEEMAELQKELSKAIRGMYVTGESDTTGMLEEIADVKIMLRQLMMMYNIDDSAVQAVMRAKIMRLDSKVLRRKRKPKKRGFYHHNGSLQECCYCRGIPYGRGRMGRRQAHRLL